MVLKLRGAKGGEEEVSLLTRREGTARRLAGPELAVRALECQPRDLGLDVVLSSRELLKVSGQRLSVVGIGYLVPGGRESMEVTGGGGGEPTGRLSQLSR